MPEIPSAFGYLLGLFFDSGQATPTGMGLIPLDWEKLHYWCKETCLELTIWEKETIIKMSEAYCAEYSRASDPLRKPPYNPIPDEEEMDEITLQQTAVTQAKSWRNAIRSAAKGK